MNTALHKIYSCNDSVSVRKFSKFFNEPKLHVLYVIKSPGGCTTYSWERGNAIGKGVDFSDYSKGDGIDFHNFCMRNFISFQDFGIKRKVKHTFLEKLVYGRISILGTLSRWHITDHMWSNAPTEFLNLAKSIYLNKKFLD